MPVVPVGICAMSYTKLFFRRCTKGSEKALPWNLLNPWTVFLQFVTTCGKNNWKTSIQNTCAPENGINECDVCCTHDYYWAGSYSVHYGNTCPLFCQNPVSHNPPLKTYLAFCSSTDRSIPGSKRYTCSKNRRHDSVNSPATIWETMQLHVGSINGSNKRVFDFEDDYFMSW